MIIIIFFLRNHFVKQDQGPPTYLGANPLTYLIYNIRQFPPSPNSETDYLEIYNKKKHPAN